MAPGAGEQDGSDARSLVARQLIALDDALGRPRSAASLAPLPQVTPRSRPASRPRVRPARKWAAALSRLGVPATVEDGKVVVAGFGRVATPRADKSLVGAARTFVAAQTDACRDWLVDQLGQSFAHAGSQIGFVHRPGCVEVLVEGRPFARVDRYSVAGDGIRRSLGDLRADRTPLRELGRTVGRAVPGTAPDRRQPHGTVVVAVEQALATRPGATAGELATATGHPRRDVQLALNALVRDRIVRRLPLPGDMPGYRLVRQPRMPVAPRPVPSVAPPVPSGTHAVPFEPGPLDAITDFLSESGVAVVLTSARSFRIGKSELRPPSAALTDPEAQRRWLDAVAAEHLPAPLRESVRTQLLALCAGASVRDRDGDVIVSSGAGTRLATITATRAIVVGSEPLDGNFFAAGGHWQRLAELLRSLDDGEPVVGPGVHRRLPSGTDDAWVRAAEAASAKLRTDRTIVFAHDVRIDVRGDSLLFSPLTAPPGPLEVPFEFEHGDARFGGALRLRSTSSPLECGWHQSSSPEVLARAWSLALDAYARLTCVALRDPAPAEAPRTPRATAARPSDRSRLRTPRSDDGGSVRLTRDFQPQGPTARYLASYVVGHRRRLRDGHQHSDEAAQNAALVGITLRRHETWVQPHVRGMPDDEELHFSWSGPSWLILSAPANAVAGRAR